MSNYCFQISWDNYILNTNLSGSLSISHTKVKKRKKEGKKKGNKTSENQLAHRFLLLRKPSHSLSQAYHKQFNSINIEDYMNQI